MITKGFPEQIKINSNKGTGIRRENKRQIVQNRKIRSKTKPKCCNYYKTSVYAYQCIWRCAM
jgi:hypothetical protein